MAQGIDWFRWHHGTVTDQKFPLIAKRAGASVAEVLAVWACILEAASQNAEQRGTLASAPDFEAMDCALGMADGRSEAIFTAMTDRRLIDEQRQLAAWQKRQPKREREELAPSTARVQAHRERQRQAAGNTQCGNTGNGNETPRNASSGTETPRVEESREDVFLPSNEGRLSASNDAAGTGESAEGAESPERETVNRRPATLAACPHGDLLRLFAEKAPSLPKPRPELWSGARARNLQSRWRWVLTAKREGGKRYATTTEEALAFFAKFFAHVESRDFLTGRNGRWTGCSLEWLVKDENFAKVMQGNYLNDGELGAESAASRWSESRDGVDARARQLGMSTWLQFEAEHIRKGTRPDYQEFKLGVVEADARQGLAA